jgi:hypothetical protein
VIQGLQDFTAVLGQLYGYRPGLLKTFFPQECATLNDAIAEVAMHEVSCKARELASRQHLAYPQERCPTVMDDRKAWMEKPFEDRGIEPTSHLGGVFNYLLKFRGLLRRLKSETYNREAD